MRIIVFVLLSCLLFTAMEAGNVHKIFPNSKQVVINRTAMSGNISYVRCSNSVNGPFTSPASLTAGDSLFVLVDATPSGTVIMEYFLDVNNNGVIDPTDPQIGSETYVDGGLSSPIDLDPTPGVIKVNLETGQTPSMQVIARGTEGLTTAQGIVSFHNNPKTYTFSGVVYNSLGSVIPGVMVMVSDLSMNTVGDVTDTSGYFTIPIDAGTFNVFINDWAGRYSSFDTTMTFTGNTTHDFHIRSFTSYIRGYVKDDSLHPIVNARVWIENSNGSVTDSSGMYKIMVPSGSGSVGVDQSSMLPKYMCPNSHMYTIAENDSIVNNSISNFICHRTNASITGTVHENGNPATRLYVINGWCDAIQENTYAFTDVGGNYTLPIYSSVANEQYGVSLGDWNNSYPFPPGMYPDTSYWGISAGAVANFNLVSSETSYVDDFTGNGSLPSMWMYYQYSNPWGINSALFLENDRLKVECSSNGGLAGLGVTSKKPFSLNNREFRIYADATQMATTENTIKIILTDASRNWEYPQNFKNSLQLIWEKNAIGYRQWRLVKSQNGVFTDLCTSSDSTGEHILFQFINPDTLKLTIGGTVCFNGIWGNMISMAYVYLTQFNLNPQTPAPVYFDNFVWGYLGETGVREIGGTIPASFKLEQNYPNPFNPSTNIRYSVPAGSFISVKVFNLLGQEVATLVNLQQQPGNYEVTLNSSASGGLPSGVYYYRLTAVDDVTGRILAKNIQKAVLLK